MILLVLPSSMSDLLKKLLSLLNWGDGADPILVGEWYDVIVAYVVWFEDCFRVLDRKSVV